MFKNIKMFHVVVSVLILISILTSGCTIAKISGRGSIPLLLNQPQEKVKVIKTLEATKSMAFDYTGAFDASEALREFFEETEADAVINVVVVLKTTVKDFFLNMVTLGIANARTFVITGQAVKLTQRGLSLINSPGSELIATGDDPAKLFSILQQQPYQQDCLIIRDQQQKSFFKLVRFASK